MYRLFWALSALCLFASLVSAEQVTINYTEPTASGTLAYTTVYWCLGASCTDWQTSQDLKRTSDNGNGGDAKAVPLQVRLTQGTLPVTVRVRVTATDTSNNETSGAIASHTFN